MLHDRTTFAFFEKLRNNFKSRCSEQILPAGHVNKLNDFRALNKGWLIIWDWNKYLGLDFHLYSFLRRDLFLLFLYRNLHGPWTSLGPVRKPVLWQKLRFHFSVNLYKNANIFQHFLRLQTNSRKKNVNHVVYRFSERKEVFPERITVACLHLIGQFSWRCLDKSKVQHIGMDRILHKWIDGMRRTKAKKKFFCRFAWIWMKMENAVYTGTQLKQK